MAHVFGRPAYAGARKGFVLLCSLVVGVGAWATLEVALLVAGRRAPALTGLVAGLVVLLVLAPWVGHAAKEFRRWYTEVKRSDGGMIVDRELSTLPRTYAIFNDIDWNPARSAMPGAVGHIIVGPTGVFAVRIERRAQPIARGEADTPNIDAAEQIARSLKDALVRWSGGELESIPVEVIVVYTAPGAVMERPRSGDVRVVRSFELSRAIMQDRRKDLLTAKQVYWVSRALYGRMESRDQAAFSNELEALGTLSKAAWA